MNRSSNNLLWAVCLNEPVAIQSTIYNKSKRDCIDICAFLDNFHNCNRNQTLNANAMPRCVPSESAIATVLHTYRPFADAQETGKMFQTLCKNMSTPDSLKAFIKLYASKLTSPAIKNGLNASYNYRSQNGSPYQFSEIVEACIEKVDSDAYWECIIACCYDNRIDLVERLIGMHDCPSPSDIDLGISLQYCSWYSDTDTARLMLNKYGERACKILLMRCGYARELEIPMMVSAEYGHFLTADVVTTGFNSACENRDSDVVSLYIDHFEILESKGDIDANILRDYYIDAFVEAVSKSKLDIVEVLLKQCMHKLWFDSGYSITLYEFRANANKQDEPMIRELLAASFGPRLTIDGSCVAIKPTRSVKA